MKSACKVAALCSSAAKWATYIPPLHVDPEGFRVGALIEEDGGKRASQKFLISSMTLARTCSPCTNAPRHARQHIWRTKRDTSPHRSLLIHKFHSSREHRVCLEGTEDALVLVSAISVPPAPRSSTAPRRSHAHAWRSPPLQGAAGRSTHTPITRARTRHFDLAYAVSLDAVRVTT